MKNIHVTNPNVLERLQLIGSSINPWPNFRPLSQLRSLVLGDDIKGRIINLPSELDLLSIGNSYSDPLPTLPMSLKFLTIGNLFNHPLGELPEGLQELRLGDAYDQEFSSVPLSIISKSYTLPRYILNLGKSFNKSLLPLFPSNIKEDRKFQYPIQIKISNPNYNFKESVPSLETMMENQSLKDILDRFPSLKIEQGYFETDAENLEMVLIIRYGCEVPWFLIGKLLAEEFSETGTDYTEISFKNNLIIVLEEDLASPDEVIRQVFVHPFFSRVLYLIIKGPYPFPKEFLHRVSIKNLIMKLEHRDKIRADSVSYLESTKIIYFEDCMICRTERPLSYFSCPGVTENNQRFTHHICTGCAKGLIRSVETGDQQKSYILCPHCRTQVTCGESKSWQESCFERYKVPIFVEKLL